MVHRVQEWEVANQSVFRAGEQVEFMNEQGSVLRGTICGVSREDGSAGSAQLRLDYWQQDPRAYRPGCEAAHVSGGHGSTSAHQRFGQPAGFQVPVEVRAPPGHRMEERLQSGAVRPTARESAIRDRGSSNPILSVHETFPDSRSAISGLVAEEELDYEEDIPVSGEQPVAVQQATTNGRAVQGDRLSGRRDVAANLRRGEVSRVSDVGLVSGGDNRVVVRPIKNVDVAIQAGDGVKESKSEGSTGTAQEVAGKSVVDQVGNTGIFPIRLSAGPLAAEQDFCIEQPESLRVRAGESVTIPCTYSYPRGSDPALVVEVSWRLSTGDRCGMAPVIYNHTQNHTHIDTNYTGRIHLVGNVHGKRSGAIQIDNLTYMDTIGKYCCRITIKNSTKKLEMWQNKHATQLVLAGMHKDVHP
ncbi:hypothetical protein NDU88_002976 [Pleurodeles waltl]|uniref:Ig-like domain-containing protein n=1 Tax=Pleurodeles waltl TaxID=8319 RepID=A0AAV7WR18_PLEWA|nr:hypothetical protein NDU88_002976 [Pleurodeles waltl]